jgi:hypothetical protein
MSASLIGRLGSSTFRLCNKVEFADGASSFRGDARLWTLGAALHACVIRPVDLPLLSFGVRAANSEMSNGLENTEDRRSAGWHGNQHVRLRGAQIKTSRHQPGSRITRTPGGRGWCCSRASGTAWLKPRLRLHLGLWPSSPTKQMWASPLGLLTKKFVSRNLQNKNMRSRLAA